MIGMLTQALYNFVDRAFVGRAYTVDADRALAGVQVAFPYMLVLMACAMLIGFGASAQVSIRLGEKKKEEAERVLGTAALLLGILAVVLTVVGILSLDKILALCGGLVSEPRYDKMYLGIIVYGTVFQVVGFGLNSVIRAEGNPRTAMYSLLIGVLLNFVLAYIFLFVLRWGVRGTAIATVIAQAVSAVWVVGYFFSGKSMLRLHWRNIRLDLPICGKILAIGSPMFAMQIAAAIMNSLLNTQLRYYGLRDLGAGGGDLAIAALGAIYPVMMVILMPVFGINQGTQPIIGFNFGAKRYDRVKEALLTGIGYASTLTIVGFLVIMIFPREVLGIFISPDDPNRGKLIELGAHAIRVGMMMLPLIGFQVVSASYFQATGKPREALFLMLSRQLLLLMPLVWILPRFFGLEGVWWALPSADLASSLLSGTLLFLELRHLDTRHQETTAGQAQGSIPAVEQVAATEEAR
jgi:putative MATE family efflux protein